MPRFRRFIEYLGSSLLSPGCVGPAWSSFRSVDFSEREEILYLQENISLCN